MVAMFGVLRSCVQVFTRLVDGLTIIVHSAEYYCCVCEERWSANAKFESFLFSAPVDSRVYTRGALVHHTIGIDSIFPSGIAQLLSKAALRRQSFTQLCIELVDTDTRFKTQPHRVNAQE